MFYTYILASQRNGTLYTGSTSTYDVDKLVWFEALRRTRERLPS